MTKLDFTSAKNFLISQDLEAKKTLQDIDVFFKSRLEEVSMDREKKLECLFYILLTKLKIYSVETPEIDKYFHIFLDEMNAQIVSITKESIKSKNIMEEIQEKGIMGYAKWEWESINLKLRLLGNKVKINQMKAFLHLSKYYVHTLEQIYKNMGMSDRVMELYVTRMNLKRNQFFLNRQFGSYFGFSIFKAISLYGTSFVRLALTCAVSVMAFGSIYWLADYFAPENLRMIQDLHDYSSYLFNSLVTISGLGIDASPATALQRFAMGINTIYGMVVFGMLFNVISTKLSMNN